MSTIEIKNLTKRYGEAEVLSNINMKLESGKIYGLVGRNGSGKTMLMKHILGFVKATQGTILINGKVVGENDDMQENIGAIIENPGFLPEYSGFTNLKLLAMIQGKIKDEQIKDAIRLVGLDPESKKAVGKYSLGMRQRLGLAQALMENPDILLLDEPTSHLDIFYKMEVLQTLRTQCVREGKTVICTLHEPDLAVKCCDRLVLVKGDRILACGDTGKIVQSSAMEELYGFSGRQFDPVLGLAEFPAAEGKDVFFAGSDENTVHLFRALNRMQKGFAAGVLHQNDLLFHLGKTMGVPMVTQKAYLPITLQQADLAFFRAADYEVIVAADLPDDPLVAQNRALARRLAAAGKKVMSTAEYKALLERQM